MTVPGSSESSAFHALDLAPPFSLRSEVPDDLVAVVSLGFV